MTELEARLKNLGVCAFDGEGRTASVNLRAWRGNLGLGFLEAGGAAGEATPEARALLAKLRAAEPDFTELTEFSEVEPQPDDFIYVRFRALSQVVTPGQYLDFTRPGVLQEAAPLVKNQTVYKNHWNYDVEGYVGVVNQSAWDAKGSESGGVPGINVEMMIDWRLNPKIARGLVMRPPAIHSCSCTVRFEFEFSHPDLYEQGIWWRMLGKEVDGEIVRFIVTKILEVWEVSLVHNGEDRTAKQQTGDDDAEELRRSKQMEAATAPPLIEEKQTVKLTAEQKKLLGLAAEGEEFPDAQVLALLEPLARDAEAGRLLVDAERKEVTRLATLAVLGASEGALPRGVALSIETATPETLAELKSYYEVEAAKKFPNSGRSSQEDTSGLPAQKKEQPLKRIPLH